MQSETKSRVDQLTTPAGHSVTILRFEGDIASTSKDQGNDKADPAGLYEGRLHQLKRHCAGDSADD